MNDKYIVLLEAPNQKPVMLDGIHYSLESAVVATEKYNILSEQGLIGADMTIAFVYKKISYLIKEDGK